MDLSQKDSSFTRESFTILLKQNQEILNQNIQQSEEIKNLKRALEESEKKINLLLEQKRLSNLKQFDSKSECGKHLQLEFVFDEIDESENDTAKDPSEESSESETITYTRKKKVVGRRIDTRNLPRERVVHDLAEKDKSCKQCGNQLKRFGEDVSEQLEYIPAQIKVIEHIVPKYKYSCKCCDTVRSATKPDMPIPKSMAAPSLIAEVIIKKYEHHLPWYRQSKIFAQDGIDIPANTICNWFMESGKILEPLNIALRKELNYTNILQADETPVKVLEDKKRGYMWGYHSLQPENRFILFEYNESRGSHVVNNTLDNYQGILQTDGYSGYNKLRSKSGIVSFGCWAHCRRNFADVVKLSNKSGKSHEVIKWISKLYQIEKEAREDKLDFVARKELRQAHAPPVLDKIYELFTKSNALPKGCLGKAITYGLNNWDYLKRYVDHGEAEIDNNLIENQIRPFAVSKRNWLFIGNQKAAETAAFFYSLIHSCKLNDIHPKKYLVYVLYQAGKLRRSEVEPKSLLPQFVDKDLLI